MEEKNKMQKKQQPNTLFSVKKYILKYYYLQTFGGRCKYCFMFKSYNSFTICNHYCFEGKLFLVYLVNKIKHKAYCLHYKGFINPAGN